MSSQTVICNAGPLIALGKLHQLHLLSNLYGEVLIPAKVYQEVVERGLERGAEDALTISRFLERVGWTIVDVVRDDLLRFRTAVTLDDGETAVFVVAQQHREPLLLLDDERAREEARRLGFHIRGTLGILIQAYRHQFLSFSDIDHLLQEVGSRPDIWISEKLCMEIRISLNSS